MATNLVPHPGQNILLDASGNIKLADFGLAIDLNDERAVTRAGTLDYMVGGREVMIRSDGCSLAPLTTSLARA